MKDIPPTTSLRSTDVRMSSSDPPRAGMHNDVIDVILAAEPKRIVYVSCNLATRARDLQLLDGRYKVTAVQPVDMFPTRITWKMSCNWKDAKHSPHLLTFNWRNKVARNNSGNNGRRPIPACRSQIYNLSGQWTGGTEVPKKMDGIKPHARKSLTTTAWCWWTTTSDAVQLPSETGHEGAGEPWKNKHEFRHPMLKILYEDALSHRGGEGRTAVRGYRPPEGT